MSDFRPNPTEPSSGAEQVRDVACAHYDDCLDLAVRADWDRFTCTSCPLFMPEGARKTAAILKPLRVLRTEPRPTVLPSRPLPAPEPAMSEPASAFERARSRQRRVAEIEEQLAREKELLRSDLVEAEREMAELRGSIGSAPAVKGATGKSDLAIIEAVKRGLSTPQLVAKSLGREATDGLGQRMNLLAAKGLLRKLSRGVYEAAA